MVQIGISPNGESIIIQIPIMYLSQIMDSDQWVAAIHEQCREIVVKYIIEVKK